MKHNNAKIIKVIQTTLTLRGDGEDVNDPPRIVTQYWTLKGKFLAEVDPHQRTERIQSWKDLEDERRIIQSATPEELLAALVDEP